MLFNSNLDRYNNEMWDKGISQVPFYVMSKRQMYRQSKRQQEPIPHEQLLSWCIFYLYALILYFFLQFYITQSLSLSIHALRKVRQGNLSKYKKSFFFYPRVMREWVAFPTNWFPMVGSSSVHSPKWKINIWCLFQVLKDEGKRKEVKQPYNLENPHIYSH